MRIAVHCHPKGMTLEQFGEAHRRLNAAGEPPPWVGSTIPAAAEAAVAWPGTPAPRQTARQTRERW